MKANFPVQGKEVTVYFKYQIGRAGTCFYCKKDGAVKMNVTITEVIYNGATQGPRTKLYKGTETRLKQLMFSGRAVHFATECEKQLIAEYSDHPDADIDLE